MGFERRPKTPREIGDDHQNINSNGFPVTQTQETEANRVLHIRLWWTQWIQELYSLGAL